MKKSTNFFSPLTCIFQTLFSYKIKTPLTTIEYYTQTAEQYIKLLDQYDIDENSTQTTMLNKDQIKEKISYIQERLYELEALEKKVWKKAPFIKAILMQK